MNTQNFTKSFLLRRGRFSEITSTKIEYKYLDFGNSLNSIKDEALIFTNFSTSAEKKEYKIIKQNYIDNRKGLTIANKYIIDELEPDEKVKRLINIINNQNNSDYKLSDINNIFKFKHKECSALHIYVEKDNDTLKILLIDLFHLSIKADIYSNKKKVKSGDLKKIYEKNSKNSYNLNNILKEDFMY